MKNLSNPSLIVVLLLALPLGSSPVLAGGQKQPPAVPMAPKSEEQLISDLGSSNEDKVTDALGRLEERFPTSTNAFPAMKMLLTDSRLGVRRKAARVLGILHAEVDQTDINNICALLKASEPREVIDGLKALRGLKAPGAVPEILPLLKHSNLNVMRDACRTLAVLGRKDIIPSIEPLLNNADAAVKKDAQNAIYALRAKP